MKIFPKTTTLIENVLKILSIILAIFYIMFIFWHRILNTKLPRVLDGGFNNLQVASFIILFFFSLFMIIFSINLLSKKKHKTYFQKQTEKLVKSSLGVFIITYILNAPRILYEWLYNYITIRPLIEYLGIKLWNNDPYNFCTTILFSTYIIRIFICIIFLFDIFYYSTFNYFYKSLILLLIPLIIRVALFIIKDLSKKNKEYIENEYLIIEVNDAKNGFLVDVHEKYTKVLNENQLNTLSITWVAYLANCMFVDKIYLYDDFYKKYIDLICYSFYASGWGYLLYLWFYFK